MVDAGALERATAGGAGQRARCAEALRRRGGGPPVGGGPVGAACTCNSLLVACCLDAASLATTWYVPSGISPGKNTWPCRSCS